jgi:hypothetical protein
LPPSLKLRRAECARGPGVALAETGPGHPRLWFNSKEDVDARDILREDALRAFARA